MIWWPHTSLAFYFAFQKEPEVNSRNGLFFTVPRWRMEGGEVLILSVFVCLFCEIIYMKKTSIKISWKKSNISEQLILLNKKKKTYHSPLIMSTLYKTSRMITAVCRGITWNRNSCALWSNIWMWFLWLAVKAERMSRVSLVKINNKQHKDTARFHI